MVSPLLAIVPAADGTSFQKWLDVLRQSPHLDPNSKYLLSGAFTEWALYYIRLIALYFIHISYVLSFKIVLFLSIDFIV